jgi:hypothetical protein
MVYGALSRRVGSQFSIPLIRESLSFLRIFGCSIVERAKGFEPPPMPHP